MEILKLIRSFGISEKAPSPYDRFSLNAGDRMTGKVMEIDNGGRIRMDFGHFSAWASVTFSVKKDDMLHLKVMENGDLLRLKLDGAFKELLPGRDDAPIRTQRQYEEMIKKLNTEINRMNKGGLSLSGKNSATVPMEELLLRISSYFRPIDLSEKPADVYPLVKHFIENAGLFLEKKIADTYLNPSNNNQNAFGKGQNKGLTVALQNDLKANLLLFKNMIQQDGMKDSHINKRLQKIKLIFNTLLHDIEKQQTRSIQHGSSVLKYETSGSMNNGIDGSLFTKDLQSIIKSLDYVKSTYVASLLKSESSLIDALISTLSKMNHEITADPLLSKEKANEYENATKEIILRLQSVLAEHTNSAEKSLLRILSGITGELNRLAGGLERSQLLLAESHQPAEAEHVYAFTLPIKEKHQRARLKIFYPKKRRQSWKGSTRISLLLHMKKMGNVRTDFTLMKKDLTITFFVRDERVKKNIDEYLPQVKEGLSDSFDHIYVSVFASRKKIMEFENDAFIPGDKRVDLVV